MATYAMATVSVYAPKAQSLSPTKTITEKGVNMKIVIIGTLVLLSMLAIKSVAAQKEIKSNTVGVRSVGQTHLPSELDFKSLTGRNQV